MKNIFRSLVSVFFKKTILSRLMIGLATFSILLLVLLVFVQNDISHLQNSVGDIREKNRAAIATDAADSALDNYSFYVSSIPYNFDETQIDNQNQLELKKLLNALDPLIVWLRANNASVEAEGILSSVGSIKNTIVDLTQSIRTIEEVKLLSEKTVTSLPSSGDNLATFLSDGNDASRKYSSEISLAVRETISGFVRYLIDPNLENQGYAAEKITNLGEIYDKIGRDLKGLKRKEKKILRFAVRDRDLLMQIFAQKREGSRVLKKPINNFYSIRKIWLIN